jgi:hypothetical protein
MKRWYALLVFISSIVQADCVVYWNTKPLERTMQDPLFLMLSEVSTCPGSIQELRTLFKNQGINEQISMVANRGRNNPEEGSFSFFESVYGQSSQTISINKGDLFLGYFTGLKGNTIILDQQPEAHKLLIEVIAWDSQKELYNFYELRGMDSRETRWFYRGDSADAYKDNTWLYRDNPADVPHFGNRMRCSACHNSGGPILKELSKPHNDWWTVSRPLLLEPNQPDEEVQAILQQVIDADVLADDVNTGSLKLEASSQVAQIQKELSLQEQLRPLFCTTEINLESNLNLSEHTNSIPSSFWINPLLGDINVAVAPADYLQLLQDFDMHFPETTFRDADHGWLTPVKGLSDIRAIRNLINNKQITSDFAKAVLMIDFIHPVFSSQRCELLKLLPERANEEWEIQFLTHLQLNSAHFESASLLADYLSIEENNKVLMDKIEQYKHYLEQVMNSSAGLRMSYQYLIELRKSVVLSELSQNPLGQILEPGFRVIFPEVLGSEALKVCRVSSGN